MSFYADFIAIFFAPAAIAAARLFDGTSLLDPLAGLVASIAIQCIIAAMFITVGVFLSSLVSIKWAHRIPWTLSFEPATGNLRSLHVNGRLSLLFAATTAAATFCLVTTPYARE